MHRLLVLLLLSACSASRDHDEDLLITADELLLSLDPDAPDSDQDGTSDGLEVLLHHTDPTLPDTDGDGELDGWEISVGLDPLDPASRRYLGGWPHQDVRAKADLSLDPPPSVVRRGAPFANQRLLDVHRQRVELYDFAYEDVPVVVFYGAVGVVDALLGWFWEDADTAPSSPPLSVRTAVRDRRLRLIAVVGEGPEGEAAELSTLDPLAAQHGRLLQVPVLLDDGFAVWGHLGRPGLEAPDRAASAWSFVVLDTYLRVRGIEDWQVALELVATARE